MWDFFSFSLTAVSPPLLWLSRRKSGWKGSLAFFVWEMGETKKRRRSIISFFPAFGMYMSGRQQKKKIEKEKEEEREPSLPASDTVEQALPFPPTTRKKKKRGLFTIPIWKRASSSLDAFGGKQTDGLKHPSPPLLLAMPDLAPRETSHDRRRRALEENKYPIFPQKKRRNTNFYSTACRVLTLQTTQPCVQKVCPTRNFPSDLYFLNFPPSLNRSHQPPPPRIGASAKREKSFPHLSLSLLLLSRIFFLPRRIILTYFSEPPRRRGYEGKGGALPKFFP